MTRFVRPRHAAVLAAVLALGAAPAAAQVPAVGTPDTFEAGTQNWVINLLGLGTPPPATLPVTVPGGPTGSYLQLTSVGGAGPGSRLTSINFMGQWAGNYLGAAVTAIRLDAINLGQTDLFLRLMFENPIAGPPTDLAVSAVPFALPVGSGWMSWTFPLLGPGGLTALQGDLTTLLLNTTAIRIANLPTLGDFPALASPAQVGIDNITAVAAPEPSSVALLGAGALALAAVARRRRPR